MNSKCVLLLSGGLDSGSLLYWCKQQKLDIAPLFVNYGQICFPGEARAVKYLLTQNGLPEVTALYVPSIRILGAGTLVGQGEIEPSDDYFPSRNLLLLTLAAMYGYQIDASMILIGLIGNAGNEFPDCTEEYISRAQSLLQLEYPQINILAPFLARNKIDVVQEAIHLGLDPTTTFCCNRAPDHHCWSCPSCLDRYQVLNSLNVL